MGRGEPTEGVSDGVESSGLSAPLDCPQQGERGVVVMRAVIAIVYHDALDGSDGPFIDGTARA